MCIRDRDNTHPIPVTCWNVGQIAIDSTCASSIYGSYDSRGLRVIIAVRITYLHGENVSIRGITVEHVRNSTLISYTVMAERVRVFSRNYQAKLWIRGSWSAIHHGCWTDVLQPDAILTTRGQPCGYRSSYR